MMQEFIQNNPAVFGMIVGGVAVVIVMIRIAAAIAGGRRKKAALAGGNLALIAFDEPIFPASQALTNRGLSSYKIIAVNGAEPNITGGDLLVPPGSVTVEFQYMISGSGHTNSFEQKRVTLEAEAGRKYTIEFDIMTGEATWGSL